MPRAHLWLALAALGLASCGTSTESPCPDCLTPLPPENGEQLTSDSYTLQPGEEKYFCYSYRSPADREVAIVEVEPIAGVVVHHVGLWTTVPGNEDPMGFYECPALVQLNWRPIWGAGAGSPGITLPEGVGFKVAPDTQYVVQYHLQNTGDAPVTERSAVNVLYAEDAATVTPAGIFAMGKFSLNIPAGAVDHQVIVECESPQEMHVFAAFPHMHKFGKRVEFEGGATEAEAALLYDVAEFDFLEQRMDPVDIVIQQGDFLRTTCHWDNPSAMDVGYGESSDDEMCFMSVFFYPFYELNGCVDP
jgi:hypothetical protein